MKRRKLNVMKRTLTASLILLSGFFASTVTSAQSSDPIQTIRQQYASINRNVAKYRKVKKELSGFSAEGGELIAYFKGPAIVKISATYFGEIGRATEEYYYVNEKLIFVYRKDSRYNRPLSGKIVSTAESRFYFKDDKLIRWLDAQGKQVGPETAEYSAKETDYLANSRQFTAGARGKSRTIESEP
jgi:hypothetical protein